MNLFWITLVTFAASFGVQFAFYLYYRYKSHPLIKTHKAVVNYTSGIIGDGVLMPLTNIFAFSVLTSLNYRFDAITLLWALLGGIITVFIFHWGQEYFHLHNWTMPESGRWNLLGVYHAMFMFAESSFLCFVLINYLQIALKNGFMAIPQSALYSGLLAMFIFFVTFVYDYWDSLFSRWLKR